MTHAWHCQNIVFDGVRTIEAANPDLERYYKCEGVENGLALGDTYPVPPCFLDNTDKQILAILNISPGLTADNVKCQINIFLSGNLHFHNVNAPTKLNKNKWKISIEVKLYQLKNYNKLYKIVEICFKNFILKAETYSKKILDKRLFKVIWRNESLSSIEVIYVGCLAD